MVNDATKLLFLTCCLGLSVAAPAAAFAQDQKEVYVAKVDPDGVQRVRIEGGGYFFKPNHIVVKVNVPVELLASREAGVTPHNLVIKAPEAGITIEEELAAEPKKITFTATAIGKYPIYCGKNPCSSRATANAAWKEFSRSFRRIFMREWRNNLSAKPLA